MKAKRVACWILGLVLCLGTVMGQPIVPPRSGIGSVDSTASAYAARMGLSTLGSNRVQGFVLTLKGYGLWNSLVDGWLGRSSVNAAALNNNQTFIRSNVVVTQDSPVYSDEGVYIAGSATMRIYWNNVPHTPTNTMIVQYRVRKKDSGFSHNGNNFFYHWGGSFNAGYTATTLNLNSGNVYLSTFGAGGGDANMTTYDVAGAEQDNIFWLRTTSIIRNPTRGMFAYLDGVPAANGQTTNYLGAVATAGDMGLTNIQFGFQQGTYYVPCQAVNWLLFNRELSREEIAAATAALDCANGFNENKIAYGDSRIVRWYGGEPSWFGLMSRRGSQRSVHFYDGARSGSFVTDLLQPRFLTNILQWSPRPPIQTSTVYILSDYNEATNSALSLWQAYSNVAVALRTNGFNVVSVLPTLGNNRDSVVSPMHQLVTSNAILFDRVVDLNEVVNDYEFVDASKYYSPDTLHFETNMARVVSEYVADGTRFEPRLTIGRAVPVSGSPFYWTNIYAAPFVMSSSGGTVTGVGLETNLIASASPFTTPPVFPGQWIVITNSVAPTVRLWPCR